MKSDNPKEDLNMLGCIVQHSKFKHEELYTPKELKQIKEKFLGLYAKQQEQFNEISSYFQKITSEESVRVVEPVITD